MIGLACALVLSLAEDPTPWDFLRKAYDRNGDGRITRAEYTRDDEHFQRLDRDGDGAITTADFAAAGRGKAREGPPPFERGAPPKVGEPAPDFGLDELRAAAEKKAPPPKPTPPKEGEPAAARSSRSR